MNAKRGAVRKGDAPIRIRRVQPGVARLQRTPAGGKFVIHDERIYYGRAGRQDVAAVDGIAGELAEITARIPGHVWQKTQREDPRPQRYSPLADLGRFVEDVKQTYAEYRERR